MTHTKHRKRRERARREELAKSPFGAELGKLQRLLAAPLEPDHHWWGQGSSKTEESARRAADHILRTGRAG